jgi:hypothetical protein
VEAVARRGARRDAARVALVLRAIVAWSLPLDATDVIRERAPDERGHLDIVQLLAEGKAPAWPVNTTSAYAAFSPLRHALGILRDLGDRVDLCQPLRRPRLTRRDPRGRRAPRFSSPRSSCRVSSSKGWYVSRSAATATARNGFATFASGRIICR